MMDKKFFSRVHFDGHPLFHYSPIPLFHHSVVSFPHSQGQSLGLGRSRGFSLLELLVSILLLSIIAAMAYSVLNVGIKFTGKGEAQLLALARKQGVVNLLHSQVTSSLYDNRHKKNLIFARDDMLRLVTRNPLIYYDARIVLAIYRYKADEHAIYYTEKKDFYNEEYDEKYLPDFKDMQPLIATTGEFAMEFDEESGEMRLNYDGSGYTFKPKCRNEQ